jgi:hypothetical protein
MIGRICAWRPRRYASRAKAIFAVVIVFAVGGSAPRAALAQSHALTPPQTVTGVMFAIRAASLQMISPGAANGPQPTARFSIAITNTNKSSIGLIIEPGPSGASTDSGLDLKLFNSSIARGFKTCNPCTNIPDAEWIVLQPNQADNAIVGFFAYVREPQRHRNAENADLTLILLIKEAGQGPTRAVLSWSDIPIRNEIQ